MFNFSMLTTRPPAAAFGQMRSFLRVLGVRMVDIFAVGKKFKIVQAIVCSVKVLVIDFKTPRYFAVKRFPYQSVNGPTSVNAVFTEAHRRIVFDQHWLDWPRGGVATPRFAVLYGEHGCDAGVQERGYVGQFGSHLQHLLGFNNLFGGKTSAACYTTNIAKIADFVQSLVSKYWSPKFHLFTLSTYRYYMPVNIKGQA